MVRPQRRAPRRPSAEILRILVVDDDPAQLEIVERILVDHGHRVTTASRVAPAIASLKRQPYDVLITDLVMPDTTGMDLGGYVRESHPDISLILMSGYPSIATALDPTRLGAHAFLEKPLSPEELTTTVDTCTAPAAARRLTAADTRQAGNGDGVRWGMWGDSPEMLVVHGMILKVAPIDVAVLLLGKSGTGKELVARAIHQESPRSGGPFVPVNCAAIPKELAESLLFGYLRGSFTGADRDHEGYFAQADGGTLFLDEIAELPPNVQSKLLRALQDGRIRRLGAKEEVQVNVRVIAATNKDLDEAMKRGEFRPELFYRIERTRIELPPLRDRGNDVIAIAEHFLGASAREIGKEPLQFTSAAKAALLDYDWPGNVRELENVAERLALFCESDIIDVDDLPKRFQGAAGPRRQDADSLAVPGPDAPLRAVIRWHCRRALGYFLGNKSQTALSLGIRRQTLNRHLDAQNNRDEKGRGC